MSAPAQPAATDSPSERVICFDGDCGLCRVAVGALQTLRLVPPERCRPMQSFEGELAMRIADADAHNELAVWDEASDRIVTGSDGLLWAMEGSWLTPLLPVARLAPVRALLRFGYRLVAYNRRVLSPVPVGPIRCACDPDYRVVPRWSFIALAVTITWIFLGVALGPASIVFVAPWVVALPFGGRHLDHPSTWIAHVAWVGFLAAAVVAALAWLPVGPAWPRYAAPLALVGGITLRGTKLALPKGVRLGLLAAMAVAGGLALAWSPGA